MSIAEEIAPGLRERKKQRTRSTLIDVAAELCLRQGYEKTTVEQIAAAAEVSPRTFSRYFSTKEAVIAAIADEVDEFVAEALAEQPFNINEHEALLRAHLQIFSPNGPVAPAAFNRMAVLIQIVNASATLNASAFSFKQRHGAKSNIAMSQRMGVSIDDVGLGLIADSWTLIFANSFAGMGMSDRDPIEASILCERLKSTYAIFARTWLPWRDDQRPAGQPPAGERAH